jgi:hypothetical protein
MFLQNRLLNQRKTNRKHRSKNTEKSIEKQSKSIPKQRRTAKKTRFSIVFTLIFHRLLEKIDRQDKKKKKNLAFAYSLLFALFGAITVDFRHFFSSPQRSLIRTHLTHCHPATATHHPLSRACLATPPKTAKTAHKMIAHASHFAPKNSNSDKMCSRCSEKSKIEQGTWLFFFSYFILLLLLLLL